MEAGAAGFRTSEVRAACQYLLTDHLPPDEGDTGGQGQTEILSAVRDARGSAAACASPRPGNQEARVGETQVEESGIRGIMPPLPGLGMRSMLHPSGLSHMFPAMPTDVVLTAQSAQIAAVPPGRSAPDRVERQSPQGALLPVLQGGMGHYAHRRRRLRRGHRDQTRTSEAATRPPQRRRTVEKALCPLSQLKARVAAHMRAGGDATVSGRRSPPVLPAPADLSHPVHPPGAEQTPRRGPSCFLSPIPGGPAGRLLHRLAAGRRTRTTTSRGRAVLMRRDRVAQATYSPPCEYSLSGQYA